MSLLYIALSLMAGAAAPRLFTLEATQNVWDVGVADMNGNGYKDIMLLVNDEAAFPLQKELSLYLADETGGYPPHPSYRLALPAETGAVIKAEVDGTPPVEIVAAHGAGAAIYRFVGDGFAFMDSVEFSSLFPTNSREPRFIRTGAMDLRGDGIDEWLLPTALGLEIRTLEGPVATVACDVVSEMRSGDSLYITHRLPDFQSFEIEGQNTRGLAFLSDEFADFAYGPDWSEQVRIHLPVHLEEKWDASSKLEDITGNGFPDLIVTQTRGTARMYAETHVYLAKAPFEYPETPNAVFSSSGAVTSPMAMDVDGNGTKDMVFISVPFGMQNLINFFVRGKITVRSEVYLYDDNGFSKTADYSTSMTMDAPEGRSRVAYTFGDFNGDGMVDVAYGRASNALAIFTGDRQRFISSRPWVTFDIPSFGAARPYDLNNNGAMDIVLFRPGGDHAKRVDVMVFNRD